MCLYHGTTYGAWKKIYTDGVIKTANASISPYANQGSRATEYGYVYLVDNIIDAVEYASWAASAIEENHHQAHRLLVVIKVDVPKCNLEIDPIDTRSKPMTYGKGSYLRIKRNITMEEIVAIAGFQYENFQASCDDIDAWIKKEELLQKIKWKKPALILTSWNGTANYFNNR